MTVERDPQQTGQGGFMVYDNEVDCQTGVVSSHEIVVDRGPGEGAVHLPIEGAHQMAEGSIYETVCSWSDE